MDDLLLAWRNVGRNPRRSGLTMLAVAFAATLLVFMLSFQFGAYEDMINASVKLNTGHLQIQAAGYNAKPEIRKTVNDPAGVAQAARKVSGLVGVSTRSRAFVLAASDHRTRGAMVIGVDPDTEPTVSTLPAQIQSGRYLRKDDPGAAVIGTLMAERLKVTVGNELTLLGQAKDGSVAATVVRIVGIYKAGIDEFDRSSLQVSLAEFDQVFYMQGAVHTVVVLVERLGDIAAAKRALTQEKELAGLAILDWEELMPGLKQSIQLDLVSGIIMYILLIIVVAFSILNTFLMAIFERTREFGVLMAIGTRPGRLVRLVLAESMAMTFVGLAVGMILGAGITLYFSIHGIGLGQAGELMSQYGISNRLYPRLSWLSLLAGPAAVLVITFITALYPALRIPRLKAVEAMRAI